MTKTYPTVLSIAGSDSGGGAGIQADIKTCAALGCFATTAITAITAQNTQGVHAVMVLPPALIAAQIDAVLGDMVVHAIKIGMLADVVTINTVAQRLAHWQAQRAQHNMPAIPIVLDPVMVASSGDSLLVNSTTSHTQAHGSHQAQPRIASALLQLARQVSLITPNLDEAAILLGENIQTLNSKAENLSTAAKRLQGLSHSSVLLKGGHLQGETVCDVLLEGEEETQWRGRKIATRNSHGTGCTLSSATAAYLARGYPLKAAVDKAHRYVQLALQAGQAATFSYTLPAGEANEVSNRQGALNHAFAPQKLTLR